MTKLGRKISCSFNKNVKCILLVRGNKHCVFDETTEKQGERNEQQLGICCLVPQSERENILAQIKKEKVSSFRSWKN
jgi:hypothetical protein